MERADFSHEFHRHSPQLIVSTMCSQTLLESAPRAASSNDHTSARPARVLFVMNGEDYSGAERVMDLLALRLPEFGFEVGFACVLPDRFPAACQAQHVPLYRLPMRSRGDLKPCVPLARLARQEGYDLLHSHSHRALMIARPAATLSGLPLVHHMHLQTVTDGAKAWQRWLYAVGERLMLWRTAGVVVVSDTMRQYAEGIGVARKKISLVRNGVPAAQMAPRQRLAGDPWVIGTVAMFRPRKGQEVLIEAVAKLRDAGLPVRLRAVGRFQFPDHERQVRALVARLGLTDAIDWVGFSSDVNAELAQMDAFVLPSLLAEGMPMSVLEAMAAGVPVVGSRVDGIRDLIVDGENGLLFRPGDADDLARTLQQLFEDDVQRQSLRQAASRRHREEFSDRSMAAGMAEFYRGVLAQRAPRLSQASTRAAGSRNA